MSKPFKLRGKPFLRNFGIGKGLSPYKEASEATSETTDDTKKGFDWKKAAENAAKVIQGGLDSVYKPKNTKSDVELTKKEKDKKEEEAVALTPGEKILKTIDNNGEES